jgi:hypothetical protein
LPNHTKNIFKKDTASVIYTGNGRFKQIQMKKSLQSYTCSLFRFITCGCHFSVAVTKYLRTSAYKKERFILVLPMPNSIKGWKPRFQHTRSILNQKHNTTENSQWHILNAETYSKWEED